jgi:hypothetical protein
MEEEYRMQKAQSDVQHVIATNGARNVNELPEDDAGEVVIHEDGTIVPRVRDSGLSGRTVFPDMVDDDASTRGIVSPSSADTSTDVNESLDIASGIPTIRVSSESDQDKDDREMKDVPLNGDVQPNVAELDMLEKPMQAAAGDGEQEGKEPSANAPQEPFSFSNKRLCERWLDNLFMVLYEVSFNILVPQQPN